MSSFGQIARQRGTAAVELAILIPVILFFLTSALLIARSLMQATMVQRAADDAAHMIATYPQYLRRDTSIDLNSEAAAMATEALLEGGIAAAAISSAGSFCPGRSSCTDRIAPIEVGMAISADVLNPGAVVPNLGTVTIAVSSSDRYSN